MVLGAGRAKTRLSAQVGEMGTLAPAPGSIPCHWDKPPGIF